MVYNIKKLENKKKLCLLLKPFGLTVIQDLMMHWPSFLLLTIRESTWSESQHLQETQLSITQREMLWIFCTMLADRTFQLLKVQINWLKEKCTWQLTFTALMDWEVSKSHNHQKNKSKKKTFNSFIKWSHLIPIKSLGPIPAHWPTYASF